MRHACKGLLLIALQIPLLLTPTGLHSQDLVGAAERGDIDAVQALLDAGADVNAKFEEVLTALMMAQRAGKTEVVEILKRAGAEE